MGPGRPLGLARPAWLVLALGALALQLWLLYTTRPPAPVGFAGSDKLVHLCMFGGVAGLFALAGVRARTVLWASLAHAVASELVQWRWVAGRSGSVLDLLADAVGILLALWLAPRLPVRRD